jgi:hypothetical protein
LPKHIINPPVPAGVKAILILLKYWCIHRLCVDHPTFANMVAGHIIIICLITIFIFAG